MIVRYVVMKDDYKESRIFNCLGKKGYFDTELEAEQAIAVKFSQWDSFLGKCTLWIKKVFESE